MTTTPALALLILAGGAPDVVNSVAVPPGPQQVTLLAGPFRDILERDRVYLLSLDTDRLLRTFRDNAGLPATAEPYGGWERPASEVRGHCLGHYLTASSLVAEQLDDGELRARCRAIVSGLGEVRKALDKTSSHPGYLSAYPESFIDRVEGGQGVWAPYYTLHKLLAGLLEVHRQVGDPEALELASGLGDWCWSRMAKLDETARQRTLSNEHGGMMEGLADLYAVTGKPEHLLAAQAFDHKAVFDPLAAGEDRLDGLHANTQIPKLIGSARLYRLTGEELYLLAARNFWRFVARGRSYVTGGNSDNEHFFPPSTFSTHLSPATTETCNTYNMIRLSGELMRLQPDGEVGDFVERALLNHILGSCGPKPGEFTYFVPLGVGRFKTWSTPDNSFWCCVGTGMENPARTVESLWSLGPEDVWLNQYLASELRWREQDAVLRLETEFPQSTKAALTWHLATPKRLRLHWRLPAWAGRGWSVRVNGQPIDVPGDRGPGYVALDRTWHDGDRVDFEFSFVLRPQAMVGDPSVVALTYGPLVLAAELGREGLPDSLEAVNQGDFFALPVPPQPALVGTSIGGPTEFAPVAGQVATFRTLKSGRPHQLTFRPFCQINDQRYGVYFRLLSEEQWADRQRAEAETAAALAQLEARTMDRVLIGVAESEAAHSLAGERTESGPFLDRHWRHARDGGWFSYTLTPDRPGAAAVRVTYWGDDGGDRTFAILADGLVIATQTLHQLKPGHLVDVEYGLPASLVSPGQPVTITFRPQPGSIAGGIFDLRLVHRGG